MDQYQNYRIKKSKTDWFDFVKIFDFKDLTPRWKDIAHFFFKETDTFKMDFAVFRTPWSVLSPLRFRITKGEVDRIYENVASYLLEAQVGSIYDQNKE